MLIEILHIFFKVKKFKLFLNSFKIQLKLLLLAQTTYRKPKLCKFLN